jgi:hypothetical protein
MTPQSGPTPSNPVISHAESARHAFFLVAALTVLYIAVAWWLALTPFGTEALKLSNHLPAYLHPPSRTAPYIVVDIWHRFDTTWYLEIAAGGYSAKESVVFYPLYPLLIRLLSAAGLPPLGAALLLSRIGSFFLAWGLLRLFSGVFPRRVTIGGVLLYFCWPGSFILFAGYPDSLLIALLVWSILCARESRWAPAILLAGVSCFVKAMGVIALPVLAWFWWRDKRSLIGPHLLLVPFLAAYPAWLWMNHLPQPSAMYPKYWDTKVADPFTTLWHAIAAFPFRKQNSVVPVNLAALAFLAAVCLPRKVPAHFRVWAAAALAIVLTKDTAPPLESSMRYVLAVPYAWFAWAAWMKTPGTVPLTALVFLGVNVAALFIFWNWGMLV